MKNKIINSLKSKKILVLIGLIVLLMPLVAHAAPAAAPVSLASALNQMTSVFVSLLKVLQKILWPILIAIGGLLNNDILFGSGMEDKLLEIWVHIRNFINIGFVVMLLGVAIYNVTGLVEGNYALKTFLPKFAIALVAVNFSFIGMKIILDVTNVITISIFTLPSTIGEQIEGGKPTDTVLVIKDKDGNFDTVANQERITSVCKNIYGNIDVFNKNNLKNSTTDKQIEKSFYCKSVSGGKNYELTEEGKKFFARFSSQNAALVMAIQMMNVLNTDQISDALSKKDVQLADLYFNIFFSLILYIVYGTAYVVLFVVLLVRLVVLWILIPLSPAIALKIVLPDLSNNTGGIDLQEQFIKHAIVPIQIAIPMTVGYLILESFRKVDLTHSGTKLSELGMKTAMMDVQLSGLSDLQSMIIAFAAVVVVWMGVFTAADGTYASGITEVIKRNVQGGLTGVGKHLIKHTPVLPVGGGKRQSLAQLGRAVTEPLRKMENYGKPDRQKGIKGIKRARTSVEVFAGMKDVAGDSALWNSASKRRELAGVLKTKLNDSKHKGLRKDIAKDPGGKKLLKSLDDNGFKNMTKREYEAVISRVEKNNSKYKPKKVATAATGTTVPAGTTPAPAPAPVPVLTKEQKELKKLTEDFQEKIKKATTKAEIETIKTDIGKLKDAQMPAGTRTALTKEAEEADAKLKSKTTTP